MPAEFQLLSGVFHEEATLSFDASISEFHELYCTCLHLGPSHHELSSLGFSFSTFLGCLCSLDHGLK